MAVFLPLALANFQPPLANFTYGTVSQPFELFGFSASLWLGLLAILRLKGKKTPQDFLLGILPVLVGFVFLTIIPELSYLKSWDYACYEQAARAITHGTSPYAGCYLYPPLLAQGLSVGFRAIHFFRQVFGSSDLETSWTILYYFFQTAQFFAIIFLYFLSERYAQQNRLGKLSSAFLVSGLLLFNNPLFRTLRHNQINIFMLDLILIGLVFYATRPFFSGFALGMAGHLKLYSLLMLIPLAIAKRWKALIGAAFAITIFTLLAFSSEWMGFLDTWEKTLIFDVFLRNNSLLAIAANSLRLAGIESPLIATWIFIILASAGTIYFALRYWQREKGALPENERLPAHLIDALALTLWISPIAWEHHYLIAIPLLIWAFGNLPGAVDLLKGKSLDVQGLWLVASAVLMLVIPTFDLYLFSYHRLAGLIIWMVITHPRITSLDKTSQPNQPVNQESQEQE
jgi:hypothetical protein